MNRFRSILVLGLFILLTAGGCTSMSRAYPDHSADAVWDAMKLVAARPQYDEWHVRDNQVHVVEAEHRIEILRELHRVRRTAISEADYDDRTWKITVLMSATDPPRVKFISRETQLPTNAQAEAEHFFDEVAKWLGSTTISQDQPPPSAP